MTHLYDTTAQLYISTDGHTYPVLADTQLETTCTLIFDLDEITEIIYIRILISTLLYWHVPLSTTVLKWFRSFSNSPRIRWSLGNFRWDWQYANEISEILKKFHRRWNWAIHYSDSTMSVMASQITSVVIVYSTVYSGADKTKNQSSALPAFVRGIHRWPMNSPHKCPVMRKMFPFDDVIMRWNWAILSISRREARNILENSKTQSQPNLVWSPFLYSFYLIIVSNVWKISLVSV